MSFINPFFLFAVGTALLPVLYHLVRKMRARKVKFSSLIFLRATPKELIKKRRLRDLILLIVRSCILGFFAFTFARPYIPVERIPFVSPVENKSVVILLDNSYSMQYEDLFERAKAEVVKMLDEAGPVDEFAVAVFSDEVQILTELGTDMTLHRDVLNSMAAISNRTTDFYRPITRAEEILRDAINQMREIVLISDMQNYAWSGTFENWNLERDISFIPKQIASDKPVNAYIAQFSQKVNRTGEYFVSEYDIEVSPQPDGLRGDYSVELWVNGKQTERKNIENAQSQKVVFQQFELKQGTYQGHVALNDDNLNVDNRYYFSYAVEDRPSIICIDETASGRLSDAFYLESAFDLGERAEYRFFRGTKTHLSRAELSEHEIVFLTNVAELSNPQLANLKWYVENGGTLVVSFGDRVNARQFSKYLEDFGVGSTGKIEQVTTLREIAMFGEYDVRHPIFSVFAKSGAGDLFRPRFTKYIEIVPDSGAVVIATLNSGVPLLIERKIGGGKVIAFASTFDKSWNDLPLTEIYVPFVYQIAKYAVSSVKKRTNFVVGGAVLINGRPGEEWEITTPADKIFRITLDESGSGYFRETDTPGNYIAASLKGSKERFMFSVNLDMHESLLETRNVEEVFAMVAQPSESTEFEIKEAAAVEVKTEEKRQKLWRYGILFVLLLLVFETFYANRKLSLNPEHNK